MLAKPVRWLLSLALLWVFILPATTQAAPLNQSIPGTSFETAKTLGLTATMASGPVGIRLTTNDNQGYYFYITPKTSAKHSFTFYTYQPISNYEVKLRNRLQLLVLYDASKRAVTGELSSTCASSSSSPSSKACTVKLDVSLRSGQKYYLFINFHTYDDANEGRLDAKKYDGWLSWKLPPVGKGISIPMPQNWYDKDTLFGQIEVKTEHAYYLNLKAGSQVKFALAGLGRSLEMCVYRADNQAKLGCKSTTTTPNALTIKIPTGITGSNTLLVKVTSSDKQSSEYNLSYTR